MTKDLTMHVPENADQFMQNNKQTYCIFQKLVLCLYLGMNLYHFSQTSYIFWYFDTEFHWVSLYQGRK